MADWLDYVLDGAGGVIGAFADNDDSTGHFQAKQQILEPDTIKGLGNWLGQEFQ